MGTQMIADGGRAGAATLEAPPVPAWTRRPAIAADDAFLLALYDATRNDLDPLDWPEATRATFCELQWRAQRAGYAAAYPDALSEVLEIDGRPAGRVLSAETDAELVLLDLALVPTARGRGIGRQVLEGLQLRATTSGRSVRLQVVDGSPARRLYERMGFVATEVHGIHTEMRWPS